MNATSESQAKPLTTGGFLAGLGGAAGPPTARVSPITGARRATRWSASDGRRVVGGHRVDRRPAKGVQLRAVVFAGRCERLLHHTAVENSLDLYVVCVKPQATIVRLSDSMPAGIKKRRISPRHRGRVSKSPRQEAGAGDDDGLEDAGSDQEASGPRLDPRLGSDQNFLGWHLAAIGCITRSASISQQQGYVILTPDYRGSSGYSREWATGVHMGLGVNDTAGCRGR